jgi:hypothetical protein
MQEQFPIFVDFALLGALGVLAVKKGFTHEHH